MAKSIHKRKPLTNEHKNKISASLRQRPLEPIQERFWAKVIIKDTDQCWDWSASLTTKGYGSFSYRQIGIQAHRLAWELSYGKIPEGLCVLHHCDNRKCCNPSHLFLGTNQDNVNDKISKNRQARGHKIGKSEFTEQDIICIRVLRQIEISAKEIAKMYNVNVRAIYYIDKRDAWNHV